MTYPTDINGTVFNPEIHNLLVSGEPELTSTGKFRAVRNGKNTQESIDAFLGKYSAEGEPVASAPVEAKPATGMQWHKMAEEVAALKGAEIYSRDGNQLVLYREDCGCKAINLANYQTAIAAGNALASVGMH